MLDPANLGNEFAYSYVYENLPEFPPPVPPSRQAAAQAVPKLAALAAAGPDDAKRELGTAEGVQLGREKVSVSVSLPDEAPQLFAALDESPDQAPRVILHLDDIVSSGPPGNYEVYLNNTEVDRETAGSVPHFVGLLSTFGADHSHGGDEGHHGLSASYDITDLVGYLRSRGEWDDSEVSVTFVPASRPREGLALVTGSVQVGKVSIRTE
jgi:hypothetical protein